MRTSVRFHLLTRHVRIASLLNNGCTSVCEMRLKPRVEGQHAVQLKIDGRQGAATSLGYSIVESTFVIVKGAIRAQHNVALTGVGNRWPD